MNRLCCAVLMFYFCCVGAGPPGDAQPMIIPALGRPFVLGALYNEPKSEVIIGLTLWNMKNMSAKTFEKDIPHVNARLISSKNILDILTDFSLSVTLSASLNGGMVTLSGSAEFYAHKATPSDQVSVSFVYESRTHMAELTMEALSNIDYRDLIDKLPSVGATHVVTAIEYGANAMFKLSKRKQSDEFGIGIHASLTIAVNAGFADLKGRASLNISFHDNMNITGVMCDYMGDVNLEKSPMTYNDSVEAYTKLSEMINKSTAVPMKVYLTPIHLLDNKANKLVRQITEYLMNGINQRMQKYNDLADYMADLKQVHVFHFYPTFSSNVIDFEVGVEIHKMQLTQKLMVVLPLIKRGQRAEVQLAKALDQSREIFTMDDLNQYVRWKLTEAGALAEITEAVPEVIVYEAGAFESIIMDADYEYILVFTMYLYDEFENFTECLRHACSREFNKNDFCKKVDCIKYNTYISWTKQKGIATNITTAFAKFKRVVEHNKNISAMPPGKRTATIIREQPKENREESGYSIDLFLGDGSFITGIDLPTVLNITRLSNNSAAGFNITWETSLDEVVPFNDTIPMNITNSTNITEIPYLTLNVDQGNESHDTTADISDNLKFLVQFRYPDVGNWTNMTVIGREAFIQTVCDVEVRVGLYCIFGVCADATAHYEGIDNENITCSANRLAAFKKRQSEAIKHRKMDNEVVFNKTRVVVIGGKTEEGGDADTVIIYSPANRTTEVPSVELNSSIDGHISHALPSGRVLVILPPGVKAAFQYSGEPAELDTNWDNMTSKIEAIAANNEADRKRNTDEESKKHDTFEPKDDTSESDRTFSGETTSKVILIDIDLLTYHERSGGPAEGRVYAASVSIDDRVYICGGRPSSDQDIESLRTCQVYTEGPWYNLPHDMIYRRSEFSLVATDKREMYAIAGTNKKEVFGSVEKYVLGQDGWEPMPSLNEKRHMCGAAFLKGIIYVCGGWAEKDYVVLRSCEIFNLTNGVPNVWDLIEPMNMARLAFSLLPLADGQLYAFYGTEYPDKMIRKIDVYDPDLKKWRIDGEVVIGRSHTTAVIVPERYEHYQEY